MQEAAEAAMRNMLQAPDGSRAVRQLPAACLLGAPWLLAACPWAPALYPMRLSM